MGLRQAVTDEDRIGGGSGREHHQAAAVADLGIWIRAPMRSSRLLTEPPRFCMPASSPLHADELPPARPSRPARLRTPPCRQAPFPVDAGEIGA
ncbi:hypothetical protein E2562_027861 [Oryza meyeriana var. granulata]|uniref:Uncharacterized protein n=1 Tax=Oryza meyeriana var. granulata TaxID=110450 RepID=A0A6G1DPE2_9ORYZ|nr:hypothetical protein E2562_027861 [Oryza meyeriana var. granulata]